MQRNGTKARLNFVPFKAFSSTVMQNLAAKSRPTRISMQRLLACVVARLANMCDIQFGVTPRHRTLLDEIAVAGAFYVALLWLSVAPSGHRRRSAIGISVMLTQ